MIRVGLSLLRISAIKLYTNTSYANLYVAIFEILQAWVLMYNK